MAIFIKNDIRLFTLIVGVLCALNSCKGYLDNEHRTSGPKKNSTVDIQEFDYTIDISKIPKDTVDASSPDFSIVNGLFYFKNKKFSGILRKYHPKVKMTAYTSVLKGKRHGAYSSFHADGTLFETKQYKQNRITGRQMIYWKNGNLKSNYWYHDGKMEGTQKKWFEDGSPYCIFNYKNGKREGKQQAWRASGKLHINNEIINGRTYGLNRASLCYNVRDEKPVIIGVAMTKKKDNKPN